MTKESPTSGVTTKKRVLQLVMAYIESYLLGIVTCVLFTPVDLVLIGKPLWPLYPIFAVIGFFLFYFYLSPQYVFAPTFGYWLVYSLNILLVFFGVAVLFRPLRRLYQLSPLLIGFPIGFVGALGVFYTAAASI